MSNELAIAATTATLRSLLSKGLRIPDITVRSLDTARKDMTGDQVNLFLYQTLPDAAWRNMEIPRHVRTGETGQPPLPLTLYYLVTAYSDDENDIKSHALLGHAMSILHDHPLLGAAEIKSVTINDRKLKPSNLHEQVERVRITLQPTTFEEMSKLWTTFQTHYRLSAAYQVSVVLMESTRPTKTPLPVLSRGPSDQGVIVVTGSLPSIDEVRLPKNIPSAELGGELTIIGRHLMGDSVHVIFSHQLVKGTFAPERLVKTADQEIIAKLPAPGDPTDPTSPTATWPAGFYAVRVVVRRAGQPDRTSNELAFALAPAITLQAPKKPSAGKVSLTCSPMVWPGQRVSLLLGDQEIPDSTRETRTETLKFGVEHVSPGEYVVRLRVDGVDSIPLDRASDIPRFAENQKVKVTA